MGHFSPFPMNPSGGALSSSSLPLPPQAAATGGGAYCVSPAMYAPVQRPGMALPRALPSAAAEIARRRQEEEDAAIHLVHLLVTCAGAIQAGDYADATGNLGEAQAIIRRIPTTTGIGRVAAHFAVALGQRLFPAFPHSDAPAADPPAEPLGELHRQFYRAGLFLPFAHFVANQAILEAFEGIDRVHVVDLAIMDGAQWPALIQTLAVRPGGPPALRITGVGPGTAEAREVGLRLADVARSANVAFSFGEVAVDALDELQPWMFRLVPGEALAVNSVLQLHRLLVDPNAASSSLPPPIDTVLALVAAMQPRVVTVVEQEANHNLPALVERFTNALFYYGAMFDAMEALSVRTGGRFGVGADAYLHREIVDVVCGEGSSRTERHEPLERWLPRLHHAGLTQVLLGAEAIYDAARLLLEFSGAGFDVLGRGGCLTLAWHDRLLLTASVWRGV